MHIRLLGTAAGGGFPQWNCRCRNCACVRQGSALARSRTQSCVALSGDGRHWFLLNASPDLRAQIESFPPLLPADAVRGSGIQGVLLTNADLDHTLGLLLLREGAPLAIHATSSVRRTLDEGLRLSAVLECYGGVAWRQPPQRLRPLPCADGGPSGLRYAVFPVPGKMPRYRTDQNASAEAATVGYQFVAEATGARLVFIPGLAELDAEVTSRMRDADILLVDGTFWSEDEMRAVGRPDLSARSMGHLPVGTSNGSLASIASLPATHKVYLHINNTNPMLREDSRERRMVESAGVQVGWDGQEFCL